MDQVGFDCSIWQAIMFNGANTDAIADAEETIEPGERRSWQPQCCDVLELNVKSQFLSSSIPPTKTRMRSCGGLNASKRIVIMPTEAAFKSYCPLFCYAVIRRLAIPVSATIDSCE